MDLYDITFILSTLWIGPFWFAMLINPEKEKTKIDAITMAIIIFASANQWPQLTSFVTRWRRGDSAKIIKKPT